MKESMRPSVIISRINLLLSVLSGFIFIVELKITKIHDYSGKQLDFSPSLLLKLKILTTSGGA